MTSLKIINLGTLGRRSKTTVICPSSSYISRLDFQTCEQPGFPESPYPSGAVVYCSDGSAPSTVNVWPADSIRKENKYTTVAGEWVAHGIRNVTATYGTYVNSIGYAGGRVIAGRADVAAAQWTQVGSHVDGCVLKGITMVYVYWFDGIGLHFDCSVPSVESAAADPQSNIVLECTAALLAVLTMVLTVSIVMHMVGVRRSRHRSPKVSGEWVVPGRPHADGYFKIVAAAAAAPGSGADVRRSLLAGARLTESSTTLVDCGEGDQGGKSEDELDLAEEGAVSPAQAAAAAAAASERAHIGQASREARETAGGRVGSGNASRLVLGRRRQGGEYAESVLFLPTSEDFHVRVDE